MIFSAPVFIVAIFLPFLVFCIVDRGMSIAFPVRFAFVVGLSLVYYWFGPSASPSLLAVYVVGNYGLMLLVQGSHRAMLALAIINIIALFYIKATYPGGAPLGISFHAFQIVGLLVSRIRQPLMAVPAYGYFLFLTFFPQLAAGPIVQWTRVHRFFEHWRNHEPRRIRLDWILLFLAIGLGKKVLIADSLYPAVTRLQHPDVMFSGGDSLVFPFLYAVYLYVDFSSYSDIATGIALMIGMRMPINFFSPYKAGSPAVFWRRWHRTLYKFLRHDLRFIYHRLGLPSGTAFVAFVFLFSGYWHGAAWGYMIWAVGHLVYFKLYPLTPLPGLWMPLRVVVNLVVVALLWVPFALGGDGVVRWVAGLGNLIQSGAGVALPIVPVMGRSELQLTIFGLAMALCAPNAFQLMRSRRFWPAKLAAATAIVLLALHRIFAGAQGSAPFVYFQF